VVTLHFQRRESEAEHFFQRLESPNEDLESKNALRDIQCIFWTILTKARAGNNLYLNKNPTITQKGFRSDHPIILYVTREFSAF
jgi:hypothetical protein